MIEENKMTAEKIVEAQTIGELVMYLILFIIPVYY